MRRSIEMKQLESLEIRVGFIRDRIKAIKTSGSIAKSGGRCPIAPAQTWIQKYYVKKSNGKKYYYYRLMEATNRRSRTGKIQGSVKLYLGNKNSSKYIEYKAAIRRRNELKFLQSRYEELMAMYEKQISKLVGKGYSAENDRQGCALGDRNCESINTSGVGEIIPAAVEKLEASQEQLWYWLKVIAEKLGVKISNEIEIIKSG